VVADRYAAQWPVAAFGRHGITLAHSDRDRSQIYLDTLPLFTTGRARLLDNDRLIAQVAGLVRTTTPGGRDKVDHSKTGADDLCNSAAGVLVAATAEKRWVRPAPVSVPSSIGGGSAPESNTFGLGGLSMQHHGPRYGEGVAPNPAKVAADRERAGLPQ
jgi:hypothetical protein